jgi:hypothetical protein
MYNPDFVTAARNSLESMPMERVSMPMISVSPRALARMRSRAASWASPVVTVFSSPQRSGRGAAALPGRGPAAPALPPATIAEAMTPAQIARSSRLVTTAYDDLLRVGASPEDPAYR